jgi:hypothetical protein
MKATIGLISALFTYDRSLVKIGTAAFKSLNLKSISIITLGLSSVPSSAPSGALNGGLANSLCPGIRSRAGLPLSLGESDVDIASAISPRITLKGRSSWGSRGNLMSRTASTFPDVIQEMGPSVVVVPCRWSMLTPSIRIRDYMIIISPGET